MTTTEPKSKLKQKPIKLKKGRPPVLTQSTTRSSQTNASTNGTATTINARKKSSKATRTLINKHHQLQKSRASASASGNPTLVAEIDRQLEALGGLESYQAASLTGQDRDRGGDSSEKLVEWLIDLDLLHSTRLSQREAQIHEKREQEPSKRGQAGLRVLEIGCLSSRNAISRYVATNEENCKGKIEHIHRLDLHSTEPGVIQEIDFMDLPVPNPNSNNNDDETVTHDGYFDVISLSLVLNYVPSPIARGEMLRRTRSFFFPPSTSTTSNTTHSLPLLFVVLPLPCIKNSRYLDATRFYELMRSLGYEEVRSHQSVKLVYVLFRYHAEMADEAERKGLMREFARKVEVRKGGNRNNFAIVLQ